jgi:antitoxin CcdA
MRMSPAHPRSRKAPIDLSVRPDLVRRAKALGLNMSDLLEGALTRAIVEAERDRWLAENADAIEEYNSRVEERGMFSDVWRRF